MGKYKQVNINGNANRAPKYSNGPGTTPSAEQEVRTDMQRWRLLDERGCQTWHYLETDAELKAWPQSTADKYFLGLPLVITNCYIYEYTN